jgi:hypothetical protein
MRILVVAWLCYGCAFPSVRVVTGVLTKIERRQELESYCPIIARVKDPDVCHVPPVCCAYRLTVRDPDGREEWFYAFWPEFKPGLNAMESKRMLFRLHRQEIFEFPCSLYGCRTFMDYALDSDDDWRVLETTQ